MSEKFRILSAYLFIMYFLSTATVHGQILKDTSSINLLKRGVDDIYGCRFAEARRTVMN